MAYTSNHILTTIEGTFSSTDKADIWRTTFKIPVLGFSVPTDEVLEGWLDDISGTISGYFTAGVVLAGSAAKLTGLSAAVVGVDGKYLGGGEQPTTRYSYSTPPVGQGTTQQSWATSLCVSFQTTRARGRASRGRMYWPATGQQPGTDGLLPVAQQTSIIAQAVGLVNNLNSRAATNFGSGTARIAVMSELGSGTTSYVTAVSVGRKLDHQERREGELSEAHVWTPISGGLELLRDAELERRQQLGID